MGEPGVAVEASDDTVICPAPHSTACGAVATSHCQIPRWRYTDSTQPPGPGASNLGAAGVHDGVPPDLGPMPALSSSSVALHPAPKSASARPALIRRPHAEDEPHHGRRVIAGVENLRVQFGVDTTGRNTNRCIDPLSLLLNGRHPRRGAVWVCHRPTTVPARREITADEIRGDRARWRRLSCRRAPPGPKTILLRNRAADIRHPFSTVLRETLERQSRNRGLAPSSSTQRSWYGDAAASTSARRPLCQRIPRRRLPASAVRPRHRDPRGRASRCSRQRRPGLGSQVAFCSAF